MSGLNRFLNFTGIKLVFIVLLFSLGVICLGITYQDYVYARTVFTTSSKDLNELVIINKFRLSTVDSTQVTQTLSNLTKVDKIFTLKL